MTVAKLGLFAGSKKKGGAHLAPKKEKQIEGSPKPQKTAETDAAAEAPHKRFRLPEINTERIKALFNKLSKPKAPKKKYRQKKLTLNETLVKIAKLIVMVLFCFAMISPLRSCVFNNDGFVGEASAEKTAVADSGVKKKDIKSRSVDMIKIEDQPCYKVEFESENNGYRYIVNAETGEIVAQAFYKIEAPETED